MRLPSFASLLSAVILATAVVPVVACDPVIVSEGEGEGEGEGEAAAPGDIQRSAVPFNTSPAVSAADLDDAGDNALLLALDLLDAGNVGDNQLLSPVSVLEAFSMLSAGARGDTLAQLEDALRMADQDTHHDVMNAWNLGLADRNIAAQTADPEQGLGVADPVILSLVNQLFQDDDFEVEPAFLDRTSSAYDAGVQRVDFGNNPDAIRQDINAWVLDQTRTRISDLLPPDSITTDTRLVLVNALYLKAPWTTPFDKNATAPGTFRAAAGDVTVPFLHGTQSGRFASVDGVDIAEIPLRGDALSLTLFIPRTNAALDNDAVLAAWNALADLQNVELSLSLPSFTIDDELNLNEALSALGVTELFDADSCDLGGINAQESLYVSGAFHKAFVGVDDKGLEAAAATAIVVSGESAAPTPITLNVDRPFTFVIRDRALSAPLFVGRVVSP